LQLLKNVLGDQKAKVKAKTKIKRLKEINEMQPPTDLTRRNTSFSRPHDPFSVFLTAQSSSRRNNSTLQRWDKRRTDSLVNIITSSGKQKLDSSVVEYDRYGRVISRRTKFFKIDEDFDP
jgi:hypothetical protein